MLVDFFENESKLGKGDQNPNRSVFLMSTWIRSLIFRKYIIYQYMGLRHGLLCIGCRRRRRVKAIAPCLAMTHSSHVSPSPAVGSDVNGLIRTSLSGLLQHLQLLHFSSELDIEKITQQRIPLIACNNPL
jgi:hypothetical protein